MNRTSIDPRGHLWLPLDMAAVAVFVVIGRTVHAHGLSLAGFASTFWPFAAGLATGWFVLTVSHHPGLSLRSGVTMCVFTVAIGMILRVVSGQGTAFAFVLVALGFLGAVMIGWRVLEALGRRWRQGGAVETLNKF